MAVVDKSRVRFATKLFSGFNQIIKDNRFPICRPFGTPGDDKNYDFAENFWNGTYYTANEENARWLREKGWNKRNKYLREDYTDTGTDKITSNDWNAFITKLRQEFAIRFDFKKEAMKTIQCNRLYSVSDNNQFFTNKDFMMQQNYHKIYCDILSMLLYEAHDASDSSNRLPASRFSFDIANENSAPGQNSGVGGSGTRKNLDFEPNASDIEEGYHYGNNWFTGYPMREYRYRHGKLDETQPIPQVVCVGDNSSLANVATRKDIFTDHMFGYTPTEKFTIDNKILNSKVEITVDKRPRGNFDYVKVDEKGNPIIKTSGMYEVSDQFKEVISFMEAFKNKNVPYVGHKQVEDGVDEYGNKKYKTKTKNGEILLIGAITLPQDDEGYTISIKANDVNKYFMHVINLMSQICICNCNYCSCYGHEASCTCYVVKASGWCYSYMYL